VSGRPPIAVVVQRYGADVTGGSESLARAVAERLGAFYEVTVFTTCARDYVTWRNELPAGEETLGGVRVRRFPVEEERDLAAFNAYAEPLYLRATTGEEEQGFLRRQGPWVPRLVETLGAERERFVAVVFFTYLYYPTYWGLKAASDRSVLVPTAHDEPPLRFAIYDEMFALPKAFAFLTGPEEALVRSRFPIGDRPASVVGMGVEVGEEPDVAAFRVRYGLDRPYAVYAGRIDAGKGCAEMLAHYERYRREMPEPAGLVLIGTLAMPEPRSPGVRYLGYLPENEKAAALAGARAVLCPSPYESLSIVLLEGMALGTPALATARSAVLEDHCRRSNAGLWYGDADEFAFGLDLLVRQDGLHAALGENGRAYVREHYRWDAVVERYRSLIEAVRSNGARGDARGSRRTPTDP
jgi:glycosyltransferase involved in cell wall biosynthesis